MVLNLTNNLLYELYDYFLKNSSLKRHKNRLCIIHLLTSLSWIKNSKKISNFLKYMNYNI